MNKLPTAPLVLTLALSASLTACAKAPQSSAQQASAPIASAGPAEADQAAVGSVTVGTTASTPAGHTGTVAPASGQAAAADPLPADRAPAAHVSAAAPAAAGNLPLVVVHKSASCGCCTLWVDHLRDAGFEVEVRNQDNLNPIKQRLGVPLGKGSCHTAEVGGYFVEGHVPAEDVKRLLAQKPDAKGLVVPGMPAGSPGMELPDGRTQPYTVELVGRDGASRVFAQHGND